MRRFMSLVVLGAALAGLGAGSASAANSKETIHLKPAAGMMSLHKAMGSAVVNYLKGDVSVKITTDGLPAPTAVHKSRYYVAWLKGANGKVWWLGTLKMTGGMAGASGMLMITSFQSVVVTAEQTKHPMHAMGTIVLSGMAMMHH